MKHSPSAVIALAVLLPGFGGAAAAQSTLQLTNQVFQEVDAVGPAGEKQKKRVAASKVTPGTEVIYVITYRNAGSQRADKVVISNPLPKELAYKGGASVPPGSRFEVSVDDGATFGALPSLAVTAADGSRRPAQPADVTHLRWTLANAVAPGRQGSVSYRAVLK